jgi:predicted RNA binding protein YcfA (HicA-like mRNA interferase family)
MSRTLKKLLRDSGFVLLRQNLHMVWRHPSGRNFITAKTPSDRRDEKNVRSELRRFLRAQGANA